MFRHHRVALLCWLIPLLAGLSIFALWLPSRADWLVSAGVFLLPVGAICWCAGVISLIPGAPRPDADQQTAPRKLRWHKTVLAVLLTSNFAVAGGITSAVIYIMERESLGLVTD